MSTGADTLEIQSSWYDTVEWIRERETCFSFSPNQISDRPTCGDCPFNNDLGEDWNKLKTDNGILLCCIGEGDKIPWQKMINSWDSFIMNQKLNVLDEYK